MSSDYSQWTCQSNIHCSLSDFNEYKTDFGLSLQSYTRQNLESIIDHPESIYLLSSINRRDDYRSYMIHLSLSSFHYAFQLIEDASDTWQQVASCNYFFHILNYFSIFLHLFPDSIFPAGAQVSGHLCSRSSTMWCSRYQVLNIRALSECTVAHCKVRAQQFLIVSTDEEQCESGGFVRVGSSSVVLRTRIQRSRRRQNLSSVQPAGHFSGYCHCKFSKRFGRNQRSWPSMILTLYFSKIFYFSSIFFASSQDL